MADPKFEDTEPLFDETEAIDAPKLGAKAAFEQRNPRASMIMDSGEQKFAQPVSAGESFVGGALGGIISEPGQQMLATKLSGQSPEAFQQYRQAQQEQHPIMNALGELSSLVPVGSLVSGGAKAGGKVLSKGASLFEKSADFFETVANRLSAQTLNLSEKTAERVTKQFGDDGIEAIGQLLRDEAVTNTPATVHQIAKRIDRLKNATGSQLDGLFQLAEKEMPEYQKLTKLDLVQMVKDRFGMAAEEAGIEVSKDVVKRVAKELANSLGGNLTDNVLLGPNRLWREARKLERIANKYGRSSVASEASRGAVLEEIAGAIRGHLHDTLQQIPNIPGEDAAVHKLVQLSREYGMFSVANKAIKSRVLKKTLGKEAIINDGTSVLGAVKNLASKPQPVKAAYTAAAGGAEAASNVAAKVLSYGSRLGKNYSRLKGAITVGGLEGLAKTHAHLMLNDPEYRKTVSQLLGGSNGTGE